jgi:hypothetical protein
LLSRTKTCTWRSFSIEQLMGPMAKALGPLAHGQAQFQCRWHPRYEATSILELRLPMGTMAANWKKRRIRYVAVFWAALRTSRCSPTYITYAKYWCVGDKEQ